MYIIVNIIDLNQEPDTLIKCVTASPAVTLTPNRDLALVSNLGSWK